MSIKPIVSHEFIGTTAQYEFVTHDVFDITMTVHYWTIIYN